YLFFFVSSSVYHSFLHSFPTRRSSDLIPSYLIRSHEVSPSNSAYVLAFVNLIGGIFGSFLGGALSDLLANRKKDPRYYLWVPGGDRKSTRLNSSHSQISYAVFCLKKKN